MFKISKQADYGLLFLEQLIISNRTVPLSEVIERTKLPKRFLARIASILVKNKLVKSIEGKNGGYQVNYDKIEDLNLYDYLTIFHGNLNLVQCLDKKKCSYQHFCQHQLFFKNVLRQILINDLKTHRLLEILKK
jgi:Rrf2 family protein